MRYVPVWTSFRSPSPSHSNLLPPPSPPLEFPAHNTGIRSDRDEDLANRRRNVIALGHNRAPTTTPCRHFPDPKADPCSTHTTQPPKNMNAPAAGICSISHGPETRLSNMTTTQRTWWTLPTQPGERARYRPNITLPSSNVFFRCLRIQNDDHPHKGLILV